MGPPPGKPAPGDEGTVLRTMHRGKIGLLLAVALGAGALGTYELARPAGRGNPEDPRKVLVVARGRPGGAVAVLREAGFAADAYGIDGLLRKAGDLLDPVPASGARAVLELADLYGYGHVVFEDPDADALAQVDLDGPVGEIDGAYFAVISVGDLAFPHHLTVGGPPPSYYEDPFAGLLSAMFEQPALAFVAEGKARTIEEVRLADGLAVGVDMLARVERAKERVEAVDAAYRRMVQRDARGLTLLGPPHRVGWAFGAGDGVVVATRGFVFQTPDAVRIHPSYGDVVKVVHLPEPGAEARPCSAVGEGGEVPADVHPQVVMAQDGSSLLLLRSDRAPELYRVASSYPETPERDAGDGGMRGPGSRSEAPPPNGAPLDGCPLVRAGTVTFTAAAPQLATLVPGGNQVAVAAADGGRFVIELRDVPAGTSRRLPVPEGASVRRIGFADPSTLVAWLVPTGGAGAGDEPPWQLAFYDLHEAGQVYVVDPALTAGMGRLEAFVPVSAPSGRLALALADGGSTLAVLDGFRAAMDHWKSRGARRAASAVNDEAVSVEILRPGEVTVRSLPVTEPVVDLAGGRTSGRVAVVRIGSDGTPMVGWFDTDRDGPWHMSVVDTGGLLPVETAFAGDDDVLLVGAQVPVRMRSPLRLPTHPFWVRLPDPR